MNLHISFLSIAFTQYKHLGLHTEYPKWRTTNKKLCKTIMTNLHCHPFSADVVQPSISLPTPVAFGKYWHWLRHYVPCVYRNSADLSLGHPSWRIGYSLDVSFWLLSAFLDWVLQMLCKLCWQNANRCNGCPTSAYSGTPEHEFIFFCYSGTLSDIVICKDLHCFHCVFWNQQMH